MSVVDRSSGASSGEAPGSASGLGSVRYGRARQALVDATIALSGRVGFHGVTVAELSVLAGVGPRTFYNHFADLSDVFFEACWQLHEELRVVVEAAYDGVVVAPDDEVMGPSGGEATVYIQQVGSGGLDCTRTLDPVHVRIRACVEAVVGFVQADLDRARVLFVQGYAGGPAVAGLRVETVGWLVGLLVGEDGSPGSGGVRRLSAEFAVGGINGVLCSRIKADDLGGLSDLVPSFVDTLTRAGTSGRRQRFP